MSAGEISELDRYDAESELAAEPYSIAVVRELITAAFTARDLYRFCQDRPTFRPLTARFGADLILASMVDEVVDYCQKRALFGALLAAIEEHNPAQYARFSPRLLTGVPAPAEAPGGRFFAARVLAFARDLRARAGSGQDRPSSPYRGLLEYRLGDAGLFFGRDEAIEQMLRHLERSPLTILHAESGAGKTSLLQAGLAPRLLAAGDLPVYVRAYDTNPALALRRALFPGLKANSALAAAPLRSFLLAMQQAFEAPLRLCLFFDQFEEFFLHLAQDVQTAFVEELADCLEAGELSTCWVLALRSEFFGHLATFRPRIRYPFENDYRLERLTLAEAELVIAQPAAQVGVTFEPGLIDTILEDLGEQPFAPPQIQLVCQVLYEERPTGEAAITRSAYEGLGGAAGILKGHLERVLTRHLPAEERPAARRLIEALVTSDGSRASRTRADLAAEMGVEWPGGLGLPMLDTILDELLDSRLVRVREDRGDGGLPAYELAHDYLVDQVVPSPEVRARKAARELLERETLNWTLYGATMHAQTLRVVGAYRNLLPIDDQAGDLLLHSALETGVDLDSWLASTPADLARDVLLQGLGRPEPHLRARAAGSLAGYFDAAVGERLAQAALHDDNSAVRRACFESLAERDPATARQVLAAGLEHVDAARRLEAITLAPPLLEGEIADRLFSAAVGDGQERVWTAALDVLAGPEGRPYRDHWRPLRQGSITRQSAAYVRLRQSGVEIPASLRLRMVPLRVLNYLRQEAQARPLWLGARLLLLVALYLGLAWLRAWPPFEAWEWVPGAPRESVLSLAVAGDWIYVGSFDYGVARRGEEGEWSAWLQEGLPLADRMADPTDPGSVVAPIDALAVNPIFPDQVYAIVDEDSLYASRDAGATWTRLGDGSLPSSLVDLEVRGQTVLLTTYQGALYASDDGGLTWIELRGRDGLPQAEFYAVGLGAEGRPYAGGEQGLYRGTGAFPWTWEPLVTGQPVSALEVGPEEALYLALGPLDQAYLVACYTPAGGLAPAIDFGANLALADTISSLLAHPQQAGVFYVATFGQVYRATCEGQKQRLRPLAPASGRIQLATVPGPGGEPLLLQGRDVGLYQLPP